MLRCEWCDSEVYRLVKVEAEEHLPFEVCEPCAFLVICEDLLKSGVSVLIENEELLENLKSWCLGADIEIQTVCQDNGWLVTRKDER